jgi:hypothetical protein
VNTAADNRYFFRRTLAQSWLPIGVFDSDCDAKAEASKQRKDGRLAVLIGDFLFPVNDLENGAWIVCKARKSYHHRSNK